MAAHSSRIAVAILASAALLPMPLVAQRDGRAAVTTGLQLSVKEERYVLPQEELSAVIPALNGMRLEGPGSGLSQGLTRYHIGPHWRYQPIDDGCVVIDAEVVVDITVTLPRWPAAVSAPELDRERWAGILSAIRDHEYAHRDATIRAAEELTTTLLSLRGSTCTSLRRAAEGAVAITNARLDRAHAELDGR